MENLKSTAEERLKRIANCLILNASFNENPGLLQGKMGISIFFYHYAKFTGIQIYEAYADELIEDIYNDVSLATPFDFANGLTGIGWGVEYLISKGFVDADADEALLELDNRIFLATMQSPISITTPSELFGFGFYFLSRIKSGGNGLLNLGTIKKEQMLGYMIDECKRLLSTEEMPFEVPVPKLSLYQLNSIIWFIHKSRELELFADKSDKLIGFLANYLRKFEIVGDRVDGIVFDALTKGVVLSTRGIRLPVISSTPNYKAANSQNITIDDNESIVAHYINSAWLLLIYELNGVLFNDNTSEKARALVFGEEYWNQRINGLNGSNLGLLNGLAGLGIALLTNNGADMNTRTIDGLKFDVR